MKQRFLSIVAVLLLTSLCACGAQTKEASDTTSSTEVFQKPASFGEYSVTPYKGISLETTVYNGGSFTMKIPKGWQVKTVGQFFDSGVLVFDPAVPERQIFYYCRILQFLKSQQAKKELASYAKFGQSYALRADMPVMEKGTAEEFFLGYPVLLAACDKWNDASSDSSHYPDMYNIKVLEKKPSSLPAGPTCMENSITRISYSTSDGVMCEGLTAQQTVATIDAISPTGSNWGYNSVSSFMGFTAVEGELQELEDVLSECLCSFAFTEEYVAESARVADAQTDSILAQAAQMNSAYDSYNEAWSDRQTSYDIMSQQRSDATLGYDRLYDPSTGEVYRAEQGFYDSYDANRNQYSNSDLQIIDDSSQSYYLNGVDYYINK